LPVPLSVTDCCAPAVPPELSVSVKAAVRAPAADGVKVTEIEHIPPAEILPLQVLAETMKSLALAPVMAAALTVNGAVPELVTVTICVAVVVPTFVAANVSDIGDSVTPGSAAATPVPVSVIIRGLSAALSVRVMVAARALVAVAVKVAEIVQVEFAAKLLPQVLVEAKSPGLVPARTMLVMVNGPVPELVTVTNCAAEATPTVPFPSARVFADSVSVGTATPVPVKAISCEVLPVPLSLTFRLAVFVPADVGLKRTAMVQEAAAARLAPHVVPVLSMAKSPASLPAMVLADIDSAVVPLFVSVAFCAADVTPILVLPNVSVAGVSVWPAARPLSAPRTKINRKGRRMFSE
jgi:hypothetical protein